MTRQEVIDKVRTIMNETGQEEQLSLLSEDTVKLDEYISSVIPDAVNILSANENVDPFLLPCGSSSSGSQSSDGTCTVVTLPSDFLRFVAARCSGWKREVQRVFPYGGEEYKIQHNSVTTGGVNKPSCVFAHNGSSKCVECFPAGSLLYFNYVRKTSESTLDSSLSALDGALTGALCYLCAYLVYNIFEMPATGKQMYEIAMQQIAKQS